MQIIPAIDLKEGRCVRLSQGQKDTATIYDDDPVAVAKGFELAGAQTIHIVDLDAAFNGRESTNRSVVQKIAGKVNVPIQFGGGVRTLIDVSDLIESGVSRVILGTLATESIETLRQLLEEFGSKICVGIDARDGVVMTQGWKAQTNMSASDFAIDVARMGVERIIYTDITRDGMLSGPNIEQTALARKSGVQVTASGGVSSLDDIRRLREAGEPLRWTV
jgi:phosphoribosylformimino-5-aminoimidazole carboxamide ribotide isomerase